VANPDRSVSETDPRQRLKRIIEAAAATGFRYVVAPEIEFFFLSKADASLGAPRGADRASYFDQADGPTDAVREEAVRRCAEAGIPVATSHHEVAPGQHEIDLAPLDALAAADAVITVRSIVRDAAADAELMATFLPKPFTNESGSGMHAHQSLFDLKGKEVFFDGADAYGLSSVAHGFLAGQLEHASGMCALVAPLVNSYKRLGAGFEAPAVVSWARVNRSAMIRVPAAWQANDLPTRIELRLPDPSANPYLAFGAMLSAGMDGVDRKLLPPEPVEELPSLDFEPGRTTRHRLLKVPASLGAALDALREDDVMCQALGEPILHHFLNAKEIEYEDYRRQVTPWELARYLPLY
jgi:glutamine synthetase